MVEPIHLVPPSLLEAYPFDAHFLHLPQGRLHYVDEGPRDAPVVVCIHGNPTWSFYWRNLIKSLQTQYRVIALDHLGCGLSDKPQRGFDYRLESHIKNLSYLLDSLNIQEASLVVHDWGGAIGFGFAGQHPNRITSLVVTNTAAFRSNQIPASINAVRLPWFGPLAVRGFNAFARAATYRATHCGLSKTAKQGLLLPYDSWSNRIATLRFVQDIPMSPRHPSWETLTQIESQLSSLTHVPMVILWGEADFCFTTRFRDEWTRRFPAAEVHSWKDVGHYVMEDAGPQATAVISNFLAQSVTRRPQTAVELSTRIP